MIKNAFLLVTLLTSFLISSSAQDYPLMAKDSIKSQPQIKLKPFKTIDLSTMEEEPVHFMNTRVHAPKPFSNADAVKIKLDAERKAMQKLRVLNKTSSYKQASNDLQPELITGFNGKPFGGAGVPNDNTLAVSKAGIVLSAINSNINVLSPKGESIFFRNLSVIASTQLGILNRTYDPKALYDPIADRFILVFLQGSSSADTRIIVGFSETNDPSKTWNFYQIDGKPTGGTNWTDYPIIAQNEQDLYITVNLLKDDESWQEGFIESFIWQVNKADGYTGDSLTHNLFNGITHQGKSIWSICPIGPALDFGAPNMYFLSVRPGDYANDTVFLHEITNSSTSGKAVHTLKVLKSNKKYGVPPSAFQPTGDFRLQTNDARVLAGFFHDDKIQYVQTTRVSETLSSGVYHGIITNVSTEPKVTAEIISHDSLDLAYPSIAFAGKDRYQKNASMITFSHSSQWHYPGTSVVFHDKVDTFERVYSPVTIVKAGEGNINTFLADSIERWGDYTGIQTDFSNLGTIWLSGSYGDAINKNNVWVGNVTVKKGLELVDSLKDKTQISKLENRDFSIYPNPASEQFLIKFENLEISNLSLRLTDINGKEIYTKVLNQIPKNEYTIVLDTKMLPSGLYFLNINNDSGSVTHKIVVSH